ncbi:MAG: hypothetical protein CMF62_00265 [Magnetococcales bacterium]|nr:hypothetical protein [Magnetococcales bacterium]|tara:strand:+ start:569 stop:1309 length:741 start_codon:yes stop_codon:yes gene_type:complete
MTFYQDEFDADYELITQKLLNQEISIDSRLKLITKELCQMITASGKTFLIYLFINENITYDTCFYLKALHLTDNINHKSRWRNTAITLAFKNYNTSDKVLLEFLKLKPNLDFYTLSNAFMNHSRHGEVLLEILKLKPDLDCYCYNLKSLTMYAFMYCKNKEVLLELLKQKPNLKIKKDSGETVFDFCLKFYAKKSEFDFNVLEKLYNETNKQDKELLNQDNFKTYLKLRNKYKVKPIILFRYQRRS